MQESPTVACSLTKSGMSERRARWQELAGCSFLERVVTERGLRLAFTRAAEDELRDLARLERDCCGFADWTVSTADGQAVLEVRGDSDESVAAIQRMFASFG